MGSFIHEDDVYFAYGSIFPDKSKVVLFTKNYQVMSIQAIEQITVQIHQYLLDDKLNPFRTNQVYSDKFMSQVIRFLDPVSVRD